jgi:hypothetical protein
MKGVLDSMSELKDCEAKDTLMDVVKDCFDNKEKVVANEAEVSATLDSMWVDIHSDSLSEIAKAFAKLGAKPSAPAATEDTTANKDSEDKDEPKKGEDKDSEDKDEPKKGEDKDSDDKDESEEDKTKDGCNKDSGTELFATKDDILELKKELNALVVGAVKECLGIKEKTEPTGSALDSVTKKEEVPARDYSSFLE